MGVTLSRFEPKLPELEVDIKPTELSFPYIRFFISDGDLNLIFKVTDSYFGDFFPQSAEYIKGVKWHLANISWF